VLLLLLQLGEYYLGQCCSAALLLWSCHRQPQASPPISNRKLVFNRRQSGVDCHLSAPAQHLQGNVLLPSRERVNSRLAFFARHQMHHQQECYATAVMQHAPGMHSVPTAALVVHRAVYTTASTQCLQTYLSFCGHAVSCTYTCDASGLGLCCS
jgi:hypothetical protein